MIIRLKENINSVCGEYEAAKGEEMRVIKYYDDLAIYYCVPKVNFDPGIVYEACKECAEVVEDKKPEQEKCEFVSYNNEKNTIKLSCPLDDMEPLKEWKIETKLAEQKPTEENQRPFKIKIIKILPGMDHSGINLGDELYPITWGKDYYGVEVDSYRWVIPKEAAEVIETMPVEQKPEQQKPPSDYHLPNVFSQVKYFDYYMFARAQQAAGLVIDPELAHVQKKLFVPYRGHKSTKQDVIECIKTLQLWLENNEL